MLYLISLLLLPFSLAACGSKGALKSPAQVAAQQAREARKNAKAQPQQPPAANTSAMPAPASPPPSQLQAPQSPVQNPVGGQAPASSAGNP